MPDPSSSLPAEAPREIPTEAVRAPCPCICHMGTEPRGVLHSRACCPNWNGNLDGPAGDSLPHIEARVRREERACLAAHIRAIPDDDQGFHTGVRRFIDRHARLVEGTSIVAVLLAVADEIEGDDRG